MTPMPRMTGREVVAAAAGLTLPAAVEPPLDAFAVRSFAPARLDGVPEGVLQLDYVGLGGREDWALVWKPGRESATWLVNLHGHGSHGDQLFTRPDIRRDWLPLFRSAGLGILAPNLRDNAWMCPEAAADLNALLAWVRRSLGATRFVLVGGSMGGSSVLTYCALHPQDVAAAVAVCPAADLASYYAWLRRRDGGIHAEIADAIRTAYRGDPAQRRATYNAHSAVRNAVRLTMPLFVGAGTRDEIIPVSQTRRLAGALAEEDSFAYVEAPDGDHEAPLGLLPAGFRWALQRLD